MTKKQAENLKKGDRLKVVLGTKSSSLGHCFEIGSTVEFFSLHHAFDGKLQISAAGVSKNHGQKCYQNLHISQLEVANKILNTFKDQ